MRNIQRLSVLFICSVAAFAQLKQNTVEIIPNSTRSATGSIQFDNLAGTHHVGFKGANTIGADLLWELPSVDGSAGDCIQTDGAHTLTFGSCSGGGGGGTFTAPFLIMTDYIFDVTVGSGVTGDLSVTGSNTITFTTCPLGVNGADANHDVRITGGTGTAESVRITGGTCVESAAGTLIFTTLNTHTGSWHVTTSTSGLYEAFIHGAGGAPGRYIWASKGNWNLYSLFNTGGENGVCIVGAGVGATNFIVSSFKTTSLGVLSYNFSNGGCLRDFSIRMTQPDSTNIAAYTVWPPALYIVGTLNLEISNVEVTGAWNAFFLRANGNIRMNNIVGNAFNHFLDNDNGADTLDINGMHPSSAGLTSNQVTVFTTEPTIYAAYLGYQGDAKIKNVATNASRCANFHQGTTNAYSSFGSGLDGLYGLDNWECDSPGFEVDGEQVRATNMWFTTAGASRPHISQTGGSFQLSNSHFYGAPGSSNPAISLNFQREVNDGFGQVPTFLMNNSILEVSADNSFVTATFTGYAGIPVVTLLGNHFQRVPQSTWALPLISQTTGSGGGQINLHVSDNDFTYKSAGTGLFISLADDYQHVVTGNTAVGWGYSIAGNNQTVMWGNPGIIDPTNFTQGPIVLPNVSSDVNIENPNGIMAVSTNRTEKSVIVVKNASTTGFSAVEFQNSSAASVGLVGYGNSASVYPDYFLIGTNAGGADVLLYSGGIPYLRIKPSGLLLGSLESSDYSVAGGSFITNGAVAVASAAADASIAALSVTLGSYAILSSNKSGAGAYLPLSLQTSGTDQWEIDLNGNLIGIGNNEISMGDLSVIRPASGATVNLGSTGRRFAVGFIDALASVTGNFSSLLTTQSLAPATNFGGLIGAVGQAYYQTYTSQVIFPPSSSGGSVSIENNVGVLDITGGLKPSTTGTFALGDSTHKWSNIFTNNFSLYVSGFVLSGGTLNIQSGGTLSINTGSTFSVAADYIPQVTNGYSIGSTGARLANYWGANSDLSGTSTWSNGSGNVSAINVAGNLEFTGGVKFNSLTQFGAGARLLSGQSLTTAGSSNIGASGSHFATAWIDTPVFTNLIANGNFGLTVTKTVRNAAGTGTCTLIFDSGILIGGTC